MIPASAEPAFLRSRDALADFVAQFEQGTWPKPMWTHSAHVGLAAWYLFSCPLEEATKRLRLGIRKYNEAVGTPNTEDNGYHETLTMFWIAVIANRLNRPDMPADALAAVRLAVSEFGAHRDLFRDFYSFDVVKSRQARAAWAPPDRKQIPWEQE